MEDDGFELPPPRKKRFTFKSYEQSLKSVHLPSATAPTTFDDELPDNASHFLDRLEQLQQLSLAPAFVKFAEPAHKLAESMPLLLHNWKQVVELWTTCMQDAFSAKTKENGEAAKPLLELMKCLIHDLRTTLKPLYNTLLQALVPLLLRKLDPLALTELLATLVSFFKYTLIPSLPSPSLLASTWEELQGPFEKCDEEGKRMLGEVWGATIRRMKADERAACVGMMLDALALKPGLRDGIAWVVVEACQAPSRSLHNCTASVLTALLSAHLNPITTSSFSSPTDSSSSSNADSSTETETGTLLHRALTSLIHHSAGPAQFHIVSATLISHFTDAIQAYESSPDAAGLKLERLRRIMSVCETPCVVRKGSRIPQEHLSKILEQLNTLSLNTFKALPESYASLLISALTGAELSVWMGAGRGAVDRIWEVDEVALRVAGSLAESEWDGWNALVLPGLLKNLPRQLRTEDSPPTRDLALRVLSTPSVIARLKSAPAPAAWLDELRTWAQGVLNSWSYSPSSAAAVPLVSILSLVPALLASTLTSSVARIVEVLLDVPLSERNEGSAVNAPILLAHCLSAVIRGDFAGVEAGTVSGWVERIVGSEWVRNPHVMVAVVELCEARPADAFKSLDYETLYRSVDFAILSHDRRLRIGALRLLEACSKTADEVVTTTSSFKGKTTITIRQLCLAAERVPLDVAGVRERILRTKKVGTAVLALSPKDEGDHVRLGVRWLLGQLQVSLRPLWAPTSESLAALMERFPDLVWELAFAELKRASGGDLSESDSDNDGDEDEEDAAEKEQEQSWKCPNAQRRRALVRVWEQPPNSAAEARLRQYQRSPDRLDLRTYETELLGAFARAPAIVEKRSREFIPFFLSMTPASLARRRLKAYLDLFSKFTNPKALYAASTLHDLHMSMLSKPDRDLQVLALNCLFTYKASGLRRHEEQLKAILDETKWRDELAMLDMGGIEDAHRPEVVPVLTGLLYGLIGERKARRHSGPDRRSAVLQALSHASSAELSTFVGLMLTPFPPSAVQPVTGDVADFRGLGNASVGQQAGFLSLLGDVLKIMGIKTIDYWPQFLAVTLEIVNVAQHAIDAAVTTDQAYAVSDSGDDDALNLDSAEGASDSGKLRRAHRSLRQTGLKRVAEFFKMSPSAIDYEPYIRLAFPSIISPRLALLPQENTQAPSALLELVVEWSSTPETATLLVAYDKQLLPRIFECLNGVKVKPSVVSKVLDLVDRILALSADYPSVAELILAPNVRKLLQELSVMFERSVKAGLKADPITQRMIDILSALSTHMSEPEDARRLLALIPPLLKKPAKVVPEKVKANLLHVVRYLMPLVPDCSDASSAVYTKCFDSLSSLFQSLRTRNARLELVTAFQSLVAADDTFGTVSGVVASLNAYSTRRMEEPDFEQRLKAFAGLNGSLHLSLNPRGWKAVLYNMMSFIHDPEEVALRSSAAESLRLFIQAVNLESKTMTDVARPPLYELFDRMLYSALRNGLRSKSEQVRSDILGVIAFAVGTLEAHRPLQEMKPLLADGDAEANFFNNIHHIQVHRRTRALRRLADFVAASTIRQQTVSDVFVPIVEHFIGGVESLDHHLVNEAITTLGALSTKLSWSAYYALVQRHLASAKDKTGSQKTRVRSLVIVLDHFPFNMSDVVDQDSAVDKEVADDAEDATTEAITPALAPDQQLRLKIADILSQRLLPSLLTFMEQREDTEDVVRLPVAVGIAHVAQQLPSSTRHAQLEKLIIILSQALRSKSQETRDVVRETLGRITLMLGPSMLPEILKQLRAALLRGPQLHILAFVTHSLLVLVTAKENVERFSQLDDSVASIAHIAAEVIFGQSGRDVLSEDFRTKIREVRGSASRGLDTFATVAKYVSPKKISALLAPVRAIMHETEAAKAMQQVDDVLRRVATGLNTNEHLDTGDLLVLCHTLISQNAKFLQQALPPRSNKRKKNDVDVQMKRDEGTLESDAYATNSFRFVTLGLDLFNTAYRRGRFNFNDASIMERLEALVSPIGNTLYSTNSAVVSLGVRSAASIAHCPLKSLKSSLPVYLKRIFSIIRQAGSTESEAMQHTLKSLAVIIRDCPEAKVQDDDLTFLLEVILPDVEEKDRQIAVFALLRAIVSRKFVVPEIYDVMEKVAEIMVTNQSSQVQELCRGVLLQFLLDYPQGKGRLRAQMTFLAKNLSYVFESGRLSVMELLGAIIAKFDVALVQEYSELLSVALFMVIANDDSAKCREMAAELTKSLYSRSDKSSRQATIARLHVWAAEGNAPALRRTVAQVYGLLVESGGDIEPTILSDLDGLLRSSDAALGEMENTLEGEDEFEEPDEGDLDWQLAYHSLSAISKVLRATPDVLRDPAAIHWEFVTHHLVYPHAWVRLAATRLVGSLCAAFTPGPPDSTLPSTHPLSREGTIDLAHKLCAQLRSPHLDAALSLQVVKNLFYVGKCFALWPISKAPTPPAETADSGDEEEQEDEETQQPEDEHRNKATDDPLRWLFSRLSYQARSAHIARRNRKIQSETSWAVHTLSVFRWFAAMVSHLSADDVAKFLTHILAPVYRILEDDTIRDNQMDELRSTGQELQTLVREKVGTTLFANEYSKIRQGVLTVRRERRTAKAVQIATAPELAAKRKIQRNATKKASRKRKHQEFTNEKIKLGLKRARFD